MWLDADYEEDFDERNEYYLDNVREYGMRRRRGARLSPQDFDAMTEEEVNEWYECLGRRCCDD